MSDVANGKYQICTNMDDKYIYISKLDTEFGWVDVSKEKISDIEDNFRKSDSFGSFG